MFRALVITILGSVLSNVNSLGNVGADAKCTPWANQEFSGCACQMSDSGQVVNLAPLQNSSVVPRFTDTNEITSWKYSYNPCSGFNMYVGQNHSELGYKSCKNAAIARWTELATHQCFSLGPPESAVFDYGVELSRLIKSNLTVTFTFVNDTLTKNEGVISLVCNRNMSIAESKFKYIDLDYLTHSIYYFSLESRCCCPGSCGAPPLPPPTNASTTTAPKSDKLDKKVIIGLSVAAGVLLLIIIIAAICCCCKKKGYTSV